MQFPTEVSGYVELYLLFLLKYLGMLNYTCFLGHFLTNLSLLSACGYMFPVTA